MGMVQVGHPGAVQPDARINAVIPPRYQFALLTLLLVLTNVVAGVISSGQSKVGSGLVVPWAVTALIIVLCFTIIGNLPVSVGGQPAIVDWRAVLIDQRNKISLSRLQMVLWTILVLSAALTEGILNAVWGSPTPLMLNIPSQLWVLLGLSSTSFVAAPLVLGTKQERGELHTKPPGKHAWRDIFYGDDKANADQVDFSKVQQFFFTILLIAVYAIAIGHVLATANSTGTALLQFPALDDGFIGIMGVSQVAYIAYKAVPQNRTDAPQ